MKCRNMVERSVDVGDKSRNGLPIEKKKVSQG